MSFLIPTFFSQHFTSLHLPWNTTKYFETRTTLMRGDFSSIIEVIRTPQHPKLHETYNEKLFIQK